MLTRSGRTSSSIRRQSSNAPAMPSEAASSWVLARCVPTPLAWPPRAPRGARLAQLIVQHSTRLQPGEAVLIESFDLADGLVLDLIDAVHAAKAQPLVSLRSNAVIRSQLGQATEAQL